MIVKLCDLILPTTSASEVLRPGESPLTKNQEEKFMKELTRTIKEAGLLRPIWVDKFNRVLSGKNRVLAMLRLGWETCEVVLIEDNVKIEDIIRFDGLVF